MLRQAMRASPIKADATIVFMCENKPLVMTEWTNVITQGLTNADVPMPGRPVTVAFINRYLNTEDACSVAKEGAKSEFMVWRGIIH